MLRRAVIISALIVMPSLASAQQPCTTDGRRVVDEIYRHVLERAPDGGAQMWVNRLSNENATVREVVRQIAKSPEHINRFTNNESPESIITTLYRHLLNRQPEPQGLRANIELAQRRGLPAAIDAFIDSREYRDQFGDWRVPGSSGVTYCGPGVQDSQNQSSRNNMRFRGMDANKDGVISRNEWRGNARSFDDFDWNNDGQLSGDEVNVNFSRRATRAEDDEGEMDNNDRFDYLDINGNNVVDRNEWDGGYEAFARLDSNNDRRLTRSEYNGMNSGTDFNGLDRNQDGRLVLAEWPWTHRSFDRQDDNGDGVIQRNEFRGAPAQQR